MKASDQQKRLVLYADDDRDDLDFVSEAFLSHAKNIELKTFTAADALLQFIHSRKNNVPMPCLIILDVDMPDMNGREALSHLRNIEHCAKVPVVFFTTSSSPHERLLAGYSKVGFFTKPLNKRQMAIIVERFLEHCNEEAKI